MGSSVHIRERPYFNHILIHKKLVQTQTRACSPVTADLDCMGYLFAGGRLRLDIDHPKQQVSCKGGGGKENGREREF